MVLMNSFVRCTFVSVVIAVLSAVPSLAKSSEFVSRPAAANIKVDGKLGDWSEDAMTYLEEQQVTVALSNDPANVYVLVCSRKSDIARLIRMTGLSIYLDAKGEKAKDFYLKFTGGPTREQIAAISGETRGDSSRQRPPEMRGDRRGGPDQQREPKFICYQKDVISEKEIPVDGSEGPAAAFGVDKGFFIYEFSVPLKESGVRFYGIGVSPATKIGMGLVWGEFDKSKMREGIGGEGGGPGGMGGGGGMPPGGGEGGGPGGGGMGGPGGGQGGPPGGGRGGFETPKKQEVWIKVQLASGK